MAQTVEPTEVRETSLGTANVLRSILSPSSCSSKLKSAENLLWHCHRCSNGKKMYNSNRPPPRKKTEQQFGYCINGWSKAWLGLVFWCAHIIPTNVYCLTWVALGKISFKAALSHAFELHCQIPFVFFFFPLHSHIIQITLDCGKCKFHPRRFIDSYAVFMENSHSGLVQMRICTHHDTRARWNIFLV